MADRPPEESWLAELPVVVGLGSVDPALVTGVFDGHCRFIATPGEAGLAAAEGAIVRADARVHQALLRRAPRLRVIARTGVGVDLVDVPAATARGIAVVITPGAGAAAVAEGAIGMALHLVKRFGPLKPGAVLVNCGRGGLIDTDAVWRALTSGRLSGVGLDVFDPEPPGHHPLFSHPDVVLTPHLMGLSRRATAATFAAAARGVLDVLSGREPQAVADPAWRTCCTKEIHP